MPIYKSDGCNDLSNRRGITITSCVLKSDKNLNAIFCLLAHILSNIESIPIK